MSFKVLIVDDEACIRLLLKQALRASGIDSIEATSGAEAHDIVARRKPSLAILDVMLPDCSGFEVVERWRAEGWWQPVLMLTSCADVSLRVRGLSAGADDYLVKPFDLGELVARVKALQRRAAPTPGLPLLRWGNLIVDLGRKRAERAGVPVALTKTEFGILSCLAQARGQPVSREHLLAAVWGYGAEVSTRTVETHVWRLRKKVGDSGSDPQWIRNHSGLGYALETGLSAPLAA